MTVVKIHKTHGTYFNFVLATVLTYIISHYPPGVVSDI